MKSKDLIAPHINNNQLASVMNKTKWRELAELMTSNNDFSPVVRVKYLLDNELGGFSHLDWDWMKFGDSREIEWLEIDPMRRDYVGMLVNKKEFDFTEWVRAALLSKTIPFDETDGIFKIRGYIRPNAETERG